MKSQKAKKKKKAKASTQTHLPIQEIKEDVVVLKNGSLRKVLMVSSLNFALKSEDEQNAIISSYVTFLNNLDHPLQIVVQSRRFNIEPYLERIKEREEEETNELLLTQMADYRSFIKELVDIGDIMTKDFYVVVPYNPGGAGDKGFFDRVKEALKPAFTIKLKEKKFKKRKDKLEKRTRQIESGLSSIGLEVQPLDTQALIELYYSSYNPDLAFNEELRDMDKIRVEDIS
ncbi:MAG: TraC family protein [Candidatus Paceibacteria bacterium]